MVLLSFFIKNQKNTGEPLQSPVFLSSFNEKDKKTSVILCVFCVLLVLGTMAQF